MTSSDRILVAENLKKLLSLVATTKKENHWDDASLTSVSCKTLQCLFMVDERSTPLVRRHVFDLLEATLQNHCWETFLHEAKSFEELVFRGYGDHDRSVRLIAGYVTSYVSSLI